MAGAIFHLQSDNRLVEMREREYDSEALLQGLLSRYPDLLAGDQIDSASPRKWLLVSAEMDVPAEEDGGGRWSVDHLFLDQDAVPTIVEVKRSSDTRIRREVVGQMLDYAANGLLYWSVDTLRARFEAQCARDQIDPDAALAAVLEDAAGAETFWTGVKTNLEAGRVRLVFVADEIPNELRSIVEFLNSQMNPAEVLALEIRQYVGGGGERTLVPRVIGATVEARRRKGRTASSGRTWDKESFLEELRSRRSETDVAVASSILEWAEGRRLRISAGHGANDGWVAPVADHNGRKHRVITLWTYGGVEVAFESMKAKPPFSSRDLRLELLRRLNALPGMNLPEDSLDHRPALDLSALASEEVRDKFLAVLDWAFDQIAGV